MGCRKLTYLSAQRQKRTTENTGLKVVYRAKNVGQGFLSVDPLAHMFPHQSPYMAMDGNPINKIDPDGRAAVSPDDVTLNDQGVVTNVVENDEPNRFFTEGGTELSLNDAQGLDSPMLTKKFSEGDKVFESISRSESQKVLNDAGEIKLTNPMANPNALIFAVKYAFASYTKYDFGFSYLQNKLGANRSQMYNLYEGTGYNDGVPFTRFEGSNILYNLPDAGNFMWGKKAFDNQVPKSLMLKGAGMNEGGSDTPADTKAILNGYNY